MREVFYEIKNSKFIRNVSILVTGTVAAQSIAIFLSPVITRLYGPEAYGLMGTFHALISIIVPIAALTYPIAIVLPKKVEEAKAIMKLSLLVSILLSVIILIIILFFHREISNKLKIQDISDFLYFLPIVVILTSFMQVMEQWLIRTKQFSINAKATFFQSAIENISKVGIGFFYPVAQILIIFTAVSNGLRGFFMYIFTKKDIKLKKNLGKNDINKIIDVAKKHKDFPIYRAPQDFLFALQQSFPIVLLTSFFGPVSTGFYTISRTVLNLPTILIGKAVGDVFYPRVAEAKNNNENFVNLLKKSTLGLAIVGFVPYSLVIIIGPILFGFVFGKEWVIAGEYARWIAIWSFSTLLNRPSVMTLPVINAQRFHLIYTIILAIVNLTVIFLGYKLFKSALISVALFCLSGTIANIFLISATIYMSKKKVESFKSKLKE